MSLHTKIFAACAALAAVPSVSLTFSFAINSELMGTAFGTGMLFTYSAVACVAMLCATLVSLICDMFA